MEIVTAFHLFLSRQIRELVQSHVWNCERNEFVVAWNVLTWSLRTSVRGFITLRFMMKLQKRLKVRRNE